MTPTCRGLRCCASSALLPTRTNSSSSISKRLIPSLSSSQCSFPVRGLHHRAELPRRAFSTAPATKSCIIPTKFSSQTPHLSRTRILPTIFVRNCSYRRNMCRRDTVPSSTDIASGRQVLPTNVRPTHYDLTLEPDFQTFKYTGNVKIDVDVKDESSSITFNTNEIDIQKSRILAGADLKLVTDSPEVSYNSDRQETTLSFKEKLPAGSKAQLDIDFTGTLNDKLAGFYRASYPGPDGSKKYMATTQMESTDARRAFPCWDEPALKAKFTVTLVAEKNLTCLSNMDVKSEKDISSGKRAVTFNTSPLMSSYLIAFIVGELNYIETKDFRIPIRVYAPPDQDIERGRFSLDLAAQTLKFYEKEFAADFPLPKMDMIAIPDFAAGAMENWGLVTYRTVDLLFDEKTSGAATKQRVAEVVQHELAHQWFGNLVTMDFWEGLWLNEGFATWMSWYSCNAFYPEWKVWQSYVTDSLQGALSLDSLRSSHPIEVPVKRAEEVEQIFDAISYLKGASVLRMISKWLGEQTFLEGIRRYIKKHAYGNTTTTDLWHALSDASGEDVAKVMEIWTKNVGFPVVSVTENESDKTITVKQNRFLRTHDVKPEEDKTLYPVFLGLRTKDGVNEAVNLFQRENKFDVDLDFYKINADHSGFYRTFYPASRLEKLGQDAKAGKLSVEDRAGMVSDAGALASSGYQPSSGTLSLLKGFNSEVEYTVWEEITGWLGSLRGAWTFEDDKTRTALRTFSRDLSAPKAHELGWTFKESDSNVLQQFKALMFGSAGVLGDEKVVAAAKDMFNARFKKGDKTAISPNIRGSVYSINMEHSSGAELEEIYNTILEEYKTAKISDERLAALRSLGRAKDPKLIQRTLDLALSDDVRKQDIYMPIGGLRAHREGILALWAWLQKNYTVIQGNLQSQMFADVIAMSTSSMTKPEQKAEIEKFFADKDTKRFDQNLAQALDSVTAKINWNSRDKDDVEKWLEENKYL